jgi:hypothetical protein
MAVNYAEKHAEKVDELFASASITEQAVNQDYEFVGVKTVKVHSVPTVAMNDYERTGTSRYGTPSELGDEEQELTMGQDRSFTFTVDKGNSEEDSALNAGKALKRQTEQVIVPEIDRYRLARMAAGAKHTACAAVTSSNAYEKLLDLQGKLDDEGVPDGGRLGYVSTAFYKLLKQDDSFIKASDIAQEKLIKGQIGEVDGVAIMKGKGRLPVGVDIELVHPVATTAPKKLSEYKVHDSPPGISGQLVEGREYFDAFVLNNKKGALAVHRGSLMSLTVTNAAGAADKTKFTAVSGHLGELATVMGTLVYSIGADPASIALGADLSNVTTYPVLVLDTDIAATAGDKYIIALKDQNGLCIGTSGAAVACAIGA